MTRTLSLKREAIADLTTDELANVVAAAVPPTTIMLCVSAGYSCIRCLTYPCG